MLVHAVNITTPTGNLLWTYKTPPTREQVLQRLKELEGHTKPLNWYEANISLSFSKTELLG